MSRRVTFVTILVIGLLVGLGIYLYRAFRPAVTPGMLTARV
jgi:hypothetical protein